MHGANQSTVERGPGLGSGRTASRTPGSAVEKLLSSRILGLQRWGWAASSNPGDRQREPQQGFKFFY